MSTTSFGFQQVDEADKEGLVRGVFDSAARRYDLMNDLMSAGTHRLWKASMIDSLKPRSGEHLLDVAGGTGDIAFRAEAAAPGLDVTVVDINEEMLKMGRQRGQARGSAARFVAGNAEALPIDTGQMDAYTIALGIRNVTHIDRALAEAFRVLKPGGRFICLEFSPAVTPLLRPLYDAYSFKAIPAMGGLVLNDRDSYQYLVESIRRFPAPETFAQMIGDAGFERCGHRPMSGGIVYLHWGKKI